jgi:pyridoxal phosphate enzyme (YggS family)
MTIADNLTQLHQQIVTLCTHYHRPKNSVLLLAVSKGHPDTAIAEAYNAGQRAFGENYLQEALTKINDLKKLSIEWHYIGALQSNKTKKLAENFAWIHTVENLTIAERLHNQRPENLAPLNICLQVNISADPNKSGCHPNDVLALAMQCKNLTRISLRGLMTIPTQYKNLTEQRAEFRKMFEIFEKLSAHSVKIDTLSMGMSDDLEAAIAEGSTMVRIGTKVFGIRF